MGEGYIDCVWVGDQAIIFGHDEEGGFRKKELTGHEMTRVIALEARQNNAMQALLAELFK